MPLDWTELTWSRERLGESMHQLAARAELSKPSALPPPPPANAELSDWIEVTARRLGAEATALSMPVAELPRFVAGAGPSIARLDVGDGPRFLAILRTRRGRVEVLTERGDVRSVSSQGLLRAIEARIAPGLGEDIDRLLDDVSLRAEARRRARELMMAERLREQTVSDIWLLGPRATESLWSLARRVKLPRFVGGFATAYAIDYGLFVLSWWLLGRGALQGRIEWGWLLAWALLFASMLPFRLLSTWYEGKIAVAAGSLLKGRLLLGATKLDPDANRHEGVGSHLARVLESEVVESLALSGGLLSGAAGIELVVSTVVLGLGAGGAPHALLLVSVIAFFGWLARSYYVRRRRWTDRRLDVSHDLVERMVGHRTRLAQERPEAWHEGEDEGLSSSYREALAADRLQRLLLALPRAWLAVGLLGLVPAFVWGSASLGSIAVGLGGLILANRALKKLVDGFTSLADAAIAARRTLPLLEAAKRSEPAGEPALAAAGPSDAPFLRATGLAYRYADRGEPALCEGSFELDRGDRVLLTAPSGGGKSTLVSLLSGLRKPTSGTLLLEGFDLSRRGTTRWTRRVATAPQFHENHVFTESFAFNALMGRRWPPEGGDLDEAEALCRELGLGELLDKMPGGMNQVVGETGWRLSHGERSRLYLARALLQGGDLVVLDESFAALDPESLRQALQCAREKAKSLLVVAQL